MCLKNYDNLSRCEFGYEGSTCAKSIRMLPTMFIEDMSQTDSLVARFVVMRGLIHGYTCGVVASGKALVFNQNGRRELQTMDLDISTARFVKHNFFFYNKLLYFMKSIIMLVSHLVI